MFPSKQKKVHYERGTKKPSHSHRSSNSRDSGVGSSSASDRASLGTSPEIDSTFSYYDIEDQRNRPSAVKEALEAANERIRQLEAANAKLNSQLTDSNKENRTLKREKADLLNQVEFLMDDLEDEKKKNERIKRESSPRTGSHSGSKTERRSTPPRKEAREDLRHRDDERPQVSRQRRESWREMPVPLFDRASNAPHAPQPPPNNAPNPFLPKTTRPPSISVPYPHSAVTYAPSPSLTYSTRSPTERFPNDGGYHPYPV